MRKPAGSRVVLNILAILSLIGAGLARADDPKLADYFGFLPLEVYKLDTRMNNLLVKDLDGDKTEDVIVANNSRSRIDLLLSTKAAVGDDKTPAFLKPEVNEILSDRRMRLSSIPVNKEVYLKKHCLSRIY